MTLQVEFAPHETVKKMIEVMKEGVENE